MPQKNPPRCECKDCIKMKKKGKYLHRRLETRRFDGPEKSPTTMYVSDYITDRKSLPGRVRKDRTPEIEMEETHAI